MSSSLHAAQAPIKSSLVRHNDFDYSLIIEPLLPGFGYTIGNSIRRALLSSIPGFAVTRVKINDNITHEYQAIDGVVEDGMDILLNLKMLRAKILNGEEKATIHLRKTGPGPITANDFDLSKHNVEIINKDLYICSVDKDATIEIEVDIMSGIGYLSVDEVNMADNINLQNLLVDALFNPVTNVNIDVEETRVGDKTNYHKLTLNFTIDGTVTAKEIVEYVLSLLIDMLQRIKSSFEAHIDTSDLNVASLPSAKVAKKDDSIDTINGLSTKIMNILKKNNITTNTQLKDQIDNLADLPGIDEKILSEIKNHLSKLS
jgi:DNA-directed RNA polymerase subunit alpha